LKLVSSIKSTSRPLLNFVLAAVGFCYDFSRFTRYGAWRSRNYHRLEKSLSFRGRRANSGWDAAGELVHLLNRSGADAAALGYHETVGIKVLRDFVADSHGGGETAGRVAAFLERARLAPVEGGVIEMTAAQLLVGRLHDPEQFFLTRHSVRDFRTDPVPAELLDRAVRLAIKTPSVCNRQAWHVYHLDQRASIDRALTLQNGNRGFGHQVPCLLIVTADLRAFDTHGERFQHWIDGGMFAMSMTLALHALGLGACCLNWSRGGADDLRLRKLLPLDGAHTVIMMMAVGYPSDQLKVCYSARRPLHSILTHLDGQT
jgi:nitroreductase